MNFHLWYLYLERKLSDYVGAFVHIPTDMFRLVGRAYKLIEINVFAYKTC